MKIAVISDLHYPTKLYSFPNELGALTKYDLVIGLGDYVDMDIIDFIRSVSKKAFFVAGNMDEQYIKSEYPSKITLKIYNFKIGVIHGYGPPNNLAKKLLNEFENIDLLLYGHTHIEDNRRINGIQVFNPGAFCETHSIGVLDIGEKSFKYDWRIECLI